MELHDTKDEKRTNLANERINGIHRIVSLMPFLFAKLNDSSEKILLSPLLLF